MRRPLRFLAHKLDLDDAQMAQVAAVLDDLKTERAQGDVDHRRTQKLLAEALSAENFDKQKAEKAVKQQAESAARVGQAVLEALETLHGVLNAEQRRQLALLLRTGPFFL